MPFQHRQLLSAGLVPQPHDIVCSARARKRAAVRPGAIRAKKDIASVTSAHAATVVAAPSPAASSQSAPASQGSARPSRHVAASTPAPSAAGTIRR